MSLQEVSAALVMPFDARRRAADRRSPREPPPRPTPVPLAVPAAPPAQTGSLAPVFRPDLTQLNVLTEASPPVAEEPPASQLPHHLGQLVAAVREGDLGRARAFADVLETQWLVERSAGAVSPAGWRAPVVPALDPAVDMAYETLAHYFEGDGSTP